MESKLYILVKFPIIIPEHFVHIKNHRASFRTSWVWFHAMSLSFSLYCLVCEEQELGKDLQQQNCVSRLLHGLTCSENQVSAHPEHFCSWANSERAGPDHFALLLTMQTQLETPHRSWNLMDKAFIASEACLQLATPEQAPTLLLFQINFLLIQIKRRYSLLPPIKYISKGHLDRLYAKSL